LKRVAYRKGLAENSQVVAAEAANASSACSPPAAAVLSKKLKTRWRDHHKEADSFAAVPLPGVRHPAGDEHKRARRHFLDPVGESDPKGALKEVHRLEHRQRPCSLRGASLEHDLPPSGFAMRSASPGRRRTTSSYTWTF
jgi:hypothetical protein